MPDVWTIADLDALDVADWWRYEIVDGALVVSPSANRAHEFVSAELRAAIWAVLPPELTVLGPAGVAIGSSYRIPDLVVVNRSTRDASGPFRAADIVLAVEIVSSGSVTMDRVMKPAQYAAAGIAHFWRVETDPISVWTYRLEHGAYRQTGGWSGNDVATLGEPFTVTLDVARLGR